jgi:dTDP-glucose 4,6-dehydratase
VLIKKDIELLLESGSKFREFDSASITILGGTGFIGQWLIQALHEYRLNFGIHSEITVVTRNSKAAHRLFVEEFGIPVKIIEFDFTSESIELERSDFFVNGATPSRKKTGLEDSDAVFTSSFNASNSIIRSAIKYGNKPRVLNLSSGIVYGPQELGVRNQSERPISLQPNSQSGYLNAKLASDKLFSEANTAELIKSISPKLFAFAGPGIALDEHFAVGNFLRDGLEGRPITISGNPSTTRSYLYPTDLVVWVLTALLRPENLDVNIGSETPVTILELATLVSNITSNKGVKVVNQDHLASNYVPSTAMFRKHYEVSEKITLNHGLERWIESILINKQNG